MVQTTIIVWVVKRQEAGRLAGAADKFGGWGLIHGALQEEELWGRFFWTCVALGWAAWIQEGGTGDSDEASRMVLAAWELARTAGWVTMRLSVMA